MAQSRKKKRAQELLEQSNQGKGDFAALMRSVRSKPWQYAAGAAFIVLCILAGLIFRHSARLTEQTTATALARALDAEEPAEQLAGLDELSERAGGLLPDVLYLKGEAAYEAGEFDKAREAFERLRREFPKHEAVADAVEGLAFIAENEGKHADAVTLYQEVVEKWPTSFAARRQYLNIGRCKEQLGDLEEAVRAYEDQVTLFAGSHVAEQAAAALERLRTAHPELFETSPSGEDETAEAPVSEPSPEGESPAAQPE